MRATRTLSAALGLLATVSACSEEEVPKTAVPFAAPSFETLGDPAWSPRTGSEDPVVATVGEASITVSAVQRQVDQHAGALSPRQALDRLIESEVMAQEALLRGLDQDPEVLLALKSDVVRELLHTRFTEEHGVDAVRPQDLERAYNHPNIRIRFDHEDGYWVADAQVVCCTGPAAECRLKADPACFDQATPVIQAVYQELQAKAPYADADAFKAAVEALRGAYPMLTTHDLSFWYEKGVPYEQQRKFDTYNPSWVDSVIHIPEVGQISPPVRSDHAWHVSMLVRHVEAAHKTMEDPEVRQEIARNIYPAIQRRDFAAFASKLAKEYGVEIYYDALQVLAPPAQAQVGAP